jgi:hypothetical protein
MHADALANAPRDEEGVGGREETRRLASRSSAQASRRVTRGLHLPPPAPHRLQTPV